MGSTETSPLRVLIVDDEPLAAERLQILITRITDLTLVGIATDGNAAIRLVKALQPQIVLLDISMPGLSGMQVAHELILSESKSAVIFVTAFAEFAVEAFEVAAADYLLKPVALDRLERAISRAQRVIHEGASPSVPSPPTWTREFWVPHKSDVMRVAVAELDLIEAERDYMRLHLGARSFLLRQTISELARRLDPLHFIRIHRSTIVPRDRITGFRHEADGSWKALLKDGRLIRVGPSYLSQARSVAGCRIGTPRQT